MSNLFDLTGKKAVVTGASSGLGRQFSLALARHGADVALVARRPEKLEEVKKEVEALGVKCIAVQCDVNENDQIKAAVASIVDQFGTIVYFASDASSYTTGQLLSIDGGWTAI